MEHDQRIFVCSMKSVISTYKLPNNAILGNNKEECLREYITQIVSANFSLFVNKFDASKYINNLNRFNRVGAWSFMSISDASYFQAGGHINSMFSVVFHYIVFNNEFGDIQGI